MSAQALKTHPRTYTWCPISVWVPFTWRPEHAPTASVLMAYRLLLIHSLSRTTQWQIESGRVVSWHSERSSSERAVRAPNLLGSAESLFLPKYKYWGTGKGRHEGIYILPTTIHWLHTLQYVQISAVPSTQGEGPHVTTDTELSQEYNTAHACSKYTNLHAPLTEVRLTNNMISAHWKGYWLQSLKFKIQYNTSRYTLKKKLLQMTLHTM